MSKKDKLDVREDHEGFYVAWFVWEEYYGSFDEGLIVGTPVVGRSTEDPTERDVIRVEEAVSAYVASLLLEVDYLRTGNGYRLFKRNTALAALKVARAALKEKPPLFDWEVKALRAGWKPPAGRL